MRELIASCCCPGDALTCFPARDSRNQACAKLVDHLQRGEKGPELPQNTELLLEEVTDFLGHPIRNGRASGGAFASRVDHGAHLEAFLRGLEDGPRLHKLRTTRLKVEAGGA